MKPALGKNKILVVDDNPENIWPLIEHLKAEYEVMFATDGEKALHIAFSNEQPDLILLDIMMPGMDGYEVCSRLRADDYTRDIPVIFLTAKAEEQEETKGLELGAQDYITKPYNLSVVRARIKGVLNLRKEMNRRLLLKAQLDEFNQQVELQIRQKKQELVGLQKTLQAYDEKYSRLFQNGRETRGTKCVLVVDDNPENIHILIENLKAEYEVLFANNGEKALEIAFSEHQPDLILLDVMMPGMDGYEVCSRLKARADTWDIPVIFVTALGQELDETRGLNLGAVDFITKPFSMSVVHARIDAALRLKEEMDKRMVLTRKLENMNQNLEQLVNEKTDELRRVHEELIASEKKFRTIYENAVEGIFLATPEGRLLSASPSLAKILGYRSPEELVSTVADATLQFYLYSEDREKFRRVLQQKGEISAFETQARKKNGEIIWVMLCAKAVRNEKGKFVYYQGFLTDITERKQTEEMMIQTEKMMSVGGMAAGMAHEINNPLAGILQNMQVIQNRIFKDMEKNKDVAEECGTSIEAISAYLELRGVPARIQAVLESGQRAAKTVENMLSFSRKSGTDFSSCNLGELLDKTVDLARQGYDLKQNYNFHQFEIIRDYDSTLTEVMCEPGEIQQVLLNILKNGAQAMMSANSQIEELQPRFVLRLRKEKASVRIEIEDNGPGMDEATRKRIFEPFFTTKERGVGTGLGLSVSYFIITENHGGAMTVESSPGRGAKFVVELPQRQVTS